MYIWAVLLWIGLEYFAIENIQLFGYKIPVRTNFFEILLGIASIAVFLRLYLELGEAKRHIAEIENNLKEHKRRLSFPRGSKLTEEFWESVKEQFAAWKLSHSEEELAKFLLRGFSNQQIAAIRNRSLRTVENQILAIYRKSAMTGKLDFIAYFIEPLLPEEE